MTGTPGERLESLLAWRAVGALDPAEWLELTDVLSRRPGQDHNAFERAAAAIDLALSGPGRPLPDGLRRRIRERALPLVASVRPHPRFAELSRPPERPSPRRRAAWTPWLAAAAALVLAIAGWWPRISESPARPTASEERARLIAEAPDELLWSWQATEDAAATGAGGDVVWSGGHQAGYLRISGLEANDPALFQYQLWIFDRGRDERYPVDGGVFDVPAGREVVVPIDAKIEVGDPFLFAVTVERTGGVVVSSRERIVLLAQA